MGLGLGLGCVRVHEGVGVWECGGAQRCVTVRKGRVRVRVSVSGARLTWPTDRFLASTLPFILEWLLARLVQAVAFTTPFFFLMREAS